jgi:hypothetical protein
VCILFVDNPNIGDGWGCCRCHTYSALQRDRCKHCGEPHHQLGTAATPDILDTHGDADDEPEGCPHEPACPKCGPAGANKCDGCGRNLDLDGDVRLYLDGRGGVHAATHPRCHWEAK